jgi:diguanylate cyclase (GGDEF)-like protein
LDITEVVRIATLQAAELLDADLAAYFVRAENGHFEIFHHHDREAMMASSALLAAMTPKLSPKQQSSCRIRTAPRGRQTRTLLTMPLTRAGVTRGLLVVIRKHRRLSSEEQSFLNRLTAMTAAALEATERVIDLSELSLTDGLTAVPNRRRLDTDLLEVAGDEALAFVMVDVDHFKVYNDTHGHPAGDAALRTVATVLEANVRDHDVVYRYGGEEFAVLLPGSTAGEAEAAAERLRAAIERTPFFGEHQQPNGRLTVSLGLAVGRGTNSAELQRRADEALYQAKRDGRNRVVTAASA